MQITTVREGDILLYYHVEPRYWLSERAIQLGEWLERGEQPREYYHVAVAVDERTKIEAIGGCKVDVKNLVNDGSFDVFRPPWPIGGIRKGLAAVRKDIGQQYDMWLNIDDALRYLTGNRLHLPTKFICKREQKSKNCVSLLRVYLEGADSSIKLPLNASPEDVALAFFIYKVD